jgi:hypothetical protein
MCIASRALAAVGAGPTLYLTAAVNNVSGQKAGFTRVQHARLALSGKRDAGATLDADNLGFASSFLQDTDCHLKRAVAESRNEY